MVGSSKRRRTRERVAGSAAHPPLCRGQRCLPGNASVTVDERRHWVPRCPHAPPQGAAAALSRLGNDKHRKTCDRRYYGVRSRVAAGVACAAIRRSARLLRSAAVAAGLDGREGEALALQRPGDRDGGDVLRHEADGAGLRRADPHGRRHAVDADLRSALVEMRSDVVRRAHVRREPLGVAPYLAAQFSLRDGFRRLLSADTTSIAASDSVSPPFATAAASAVRSALRQHLDHRGAVLLDDEARELLRVADALRCGPQFPRDALAGLRLQDRDDLQRPISKPSRR